MPADTTQDVRTPTSWVDLAIRLSLLGGLVAWSYLIVRPFIGVAVWGGVLAVALYPLYMHLVRGLGGRHKLAAGLFVVVPVLLLAVPTALLVETLITDVSDLNARYVAGDLGVPAPPASVESWPVVGKRLSEAWQLAHNDIHAAIDRFLPDLGHVRAQLLSSARDTVLTLGQLLFSMILMGLFLAKADAAENALRALSRRISPTHGDALVNLARNTTRSVARGIVGVALVQAFLAGMGCLLAGVPAAGLWALLTLIAAIAQIPTLLVLAPVAAYSFMHAPSWVAITFSIWVLFVGLLDNVLKPMLLGRGVGVPMLVIFSGAIGGVLLSGIVGLFIGPVVLAIGYTLASTWVGLASEKAGADVPIDP